MEIAQKRLGDLIWAIDDTFNGLMAVPNLICLIALNGLVAKITKNYFDRKRGKKVAPMLSAYPDMNEEFKHDIMTENAGMNWRQTQGLTTVFCSVSFFFAEW